MLTPKGWMFFRLLLNKFNFDKQDAVVELLPEGEQQEISQYKMLSKNPEALNPKALLPSSLQWLDKIHYSWLEEPLRTLKDPLPACVVATLPEKQAESLNKRLQLTKPDHSYPESIKNFLLSHLYEAWPDKEILPQDLLPPSQLSPLLDCSKSELVELVDYLPMIDLAEEVRHIVDKKLIQAIVVDLTRGQQKYLKSCLHQKAKIQIPPLNVKEIHKDKKSFLVALHKRGLKRLSIALSGQHPDFIWHIAHMFDIGRGKILMEQCEKEEVPTATQITTLQVLQIIQQLRAKEAS
jgi:hypothetical protein